MLDKLADRLADGLRAKSLAPVWPVEANLVYAVLPADVHKRLQAAGASYYPMHRDTAPRAAFHRPDDVLVRLVTSFASTVEEVDAFLAVVGG